MKLLNFVTVLIIFLLFQTSTVAGELQNQAEQFSANEKQRHTGFVFRAGFLQRINEEIVRYSSTTIDAAFQFDAIYGSRSFGENVFLGIGLGYRAYAYTRINIASLDEYQKKGYANFSNTAAMFAYGKFDLPIDFPLEKKSSLYLSSALGLAVNDYHGNMGMLFNLSAGLGVKKVHLGPIYEFQFNDNLLWNFFGVNIGVSF